MHTAPRARYRHRASDHVATQAIVSHVSQYRTRSTGHVLYCVSGRVLVLRYRTPGTEIGYGATRS
eukprot:1439976-Rhodomonas_salina.1